MTIRLWDINKRQEILDAPLSEHKSIVQDLDFSSDGLTLASASDNEIILWDFENSPPSSQIFPNEHTDMIHSISFNPSGTLLASASHDMTIILSDISSASWTKKACKIAGRNLSWEEWNGYLSSFLYEETCPNLPTVYRSQELQQAITYANANFTKKAERIISQLANQTMKENDGNFSSTICLEGIKHNLSNSVMDICDFAISYVLGTDNPKQNNDLCWTGSLYGHAEKMIPACEKAVDLAPDDGKIRDSRGVGRVLTDNYIGAIEDFTIFVQWADDKEDWQEEKKLRQEWIQLLQQGENPFDEATLELLRAEVYSQR